MTTAAEWKARAERAEASLAMLRLAIDQAVSGAEQKLLVPNPCTVCGGPITSGKFIGAGDGSMEDGGNFAHAECYYRQQAQRAETRLAQALAQLPENMKHCTILFKECEKGHGRLIGTNWTDQGCPYCTIADLDGVIVEVYHWMKERNLSGKVGPITRAALEREAARRR